MNLFSLGGFFGSGKTTLLVLLANHLDSALGQKVAIVQNEIGAIGIDNLRLRADGLDVEELLGGCVCCELRNGLVATLRRIAADVRPDSIILEASGMATPDALTHLFNDTDLPFQRIVRTVVLDAARLQRLDDVLKMPYVENAVRTADLLVCNKIDKVTPDRAEALRQRIRAASPTRPLVAVSLRGQHRLPGQLATLYDTPMPARFVAAAQQIPDASGAHQHFPDMVVAARQLDFKPAIQFPAERLADVLQAVAADALAGGARMIAHIKAFAEFASGETATVGITDAQEPPLREPQRIDSRELGRLTVNAIVMGGDVATLNAILDNRLPAPSQ